jgi:hypothetical protein
MGRRTYATRGLREGVGLGREIRRVSPGDGTPSFGIRRPLSREHANLIGKKALDLQESGGLPAASKLEVRDNDMGVTLLSKRVIASQAGRGGLARYNLGVARAQIARSANCTEREEDVPGIKLGEVKIFRSRVVYAEVYDEGLEGEIDGIHASLAAAGLTRIARGERPYVPHLVLGEAAEGKGFNPSEQGLIVEAFGQILPEHVDVEGWESYPFDIFEVER